MVSLYKSDSFVCSQYVSTSQIKVSLFMLRNRESHKNSKNNMYIPKMNQTMDTDKLFNKINLFNEIL